MPERIHIRIKNTFLLLILLSFQPGFQLAAQDSTFQGHIMLAWENDTFFRTDYYYSNGFQIDYFHAKLKYSPMNYLLFPVRERPGSNNYYGLQLRQEIYTPKNLGIDSVSAGDHPYSANFTLSEIRIVNLPERGIRYTAAIRMGVIGPASQGYHTQELAHLVSNPSRPKMI